MLESREETSEGLMGIDESRLGGIGIEDQAVVQPVGESYDGADFVGLLCELHELLHSAVPTIR